MVVSTFRKERRQVSRLLAARSGHSHYYFRLSGSQGARRSGREQLMPDLLKVGEGEHGLRPRQVLGQAAIAHLGEAPQLLDHAEGVLAAGTGARARPIDHAPAFAQGPPGGGPPVDPITYYPAFKELAVVFFPVRLVAEHLALCSVEQLGQLRAIGDRGMGRAYGVDNTALIGPDVQLHPEVPVT